MFLDQWIKVTWNLKNLPPSEPKLSGRARVRMATSEDDLDIIFNTIESSYKTDPGWNNGFEDRMAKIREAIYSKNNENRLIFYLLVDGRRIVGASGVCATTSPQMVTGVCVIDEYRCRGYGSALLYASLKHLADAGLSDAYVNTKAKIIAGRYLYSKFGGKVEQIEGMGVKIREKNDETFEHPKGKKIIIDDIALTEHADALGKK